MPEKRRVETFWPVLWISPPPEVRPSHKRSQDSCPEVRRGSTSKPGFLVRRARYRSCPTHDIPVCIPTSRRKALGFCLPFCLVQSLPDGSRSTLLVGSRTAATYTCYVHSYLNYACRYVLRCACMCVPMYICIAVPCRLLTRSGNPCWWILFHLLPRLLPKRSQNMTTPKHPHRNVQASLLEETAALQYWVFHPFSLNEVLAN